MHGWQQVKHIIQVAHVHTPSVYIYTQLGDFQCALLSQTNDLKKQYLVILFYYCIYGYFLIH